MKHEIKRTTMTLFASLLLLPVAVSAEEGRASASRAERASALLESMDLPVAAHELRQAGMSGRDVKEAVQALRETDDPRGVERASRRSARILREEATAARDRGPMEGFGSFVRERVREGARGQELAQAIREERARRGGGQGQARGREQERERERGEAAGKVLKGKEAESGAGKAAAGTQKAREREQDRQRDRSRAVERDGSNGRTKEQSGRSTKQRGESEGRRPAGSGRSAR